MTGSALQFKRIYDFFETNERKKSQHYINNLIKGYVADIIKGLDFSQSDAQALAEKQISGTLPEGINSPNNYFYTIKEEGGVADLGSLWPSLKGEEDNQALFISDIVVNENFRGKKIGTKTLELIEEKAKELNCKTISLHVFGHNSGARKIYESLGYEAFSIHMKKAIK